MVLRRHGGDGVDGAGFGIRVALIGGDPTAVPKGPNRPHDVSV